MHLSDSGFSFVFNNEILKIILCIYLFWTVLDLVAAGGLSLVAAVGPLFLAMCRH